MGNYLLTELEKIVLERRGLDRTDWNIIILLLNNERPASELARLLGLEKGTIYSHLRYLKMHDLVAVHKKGHKAGIYRFHR